MIYKMSLANIFVQYTKILIFLIYFRDISGFNILGAKERKAIRIDRLESCGSTPNTPYKWDEVRVQNLDSGYTSIYSRGEVTRPLPKLFITMDVQRCASKESLDTCQPFASLKPLDTCKFLAMKGMAWSGLVESFTPEITCPVKKGIYESKNATFDPNLAFFFPIDNWYWKVKAKAYDGPEYMYVCFEFMSFKIKQS